MSGIDHADRAHSSLGASSAKRWMSCPASIKASEGVKKQESSIYAEEGTAAHELAEWHIAQGTEPHESIGDVVNGIMVTSEMADAVKVYIDLIKEYCDSMEGATLLIEKKFDLSHIFEGMFGTNDCCIVEPFGKLVIIDYKHGQGIAVEAEENPQLMYYGLGAMKDIEVTEVELVICQPRASHPDGPIRKWTTTPDRLVRFGKELKEAAKKTQAKNPTFNPTEEGCKFCPAAATCEALKNKVYTVAKADFDEVTELPEPSTLTNDELRRVLEASKLIGAWVSEVEKYAHILAEKGTKVPGYKLVQKRANRQWKDELEVISEFHGLFDDEDLFSPRKLKTPAQLEKIVGKENVARLTITPDTGTTLVPESDRRKEVTPSILEEFTVI